MEKKAESQQMKQMVEQLRSHRRLDVLVFPQRMILQDPVEKWPNVGALIAFHSDAFPLDKVQEYAQLRKPFVFNDLAKQKVLLDR